MVRADVDHLIRICGSQQKALELAMLQRWKWDMACEEGFHALDPMGRWAFILSHRWDEIVRELRRGTQ